MKKFIAIVIARALVAVSSTNRAGCCTFASAADQDLLLAGHPYIDEPDAVAVATPGGLGHVRTVSKSGSIRSMIIKGEKVETLVYPFMARFESKVTGADGVETTKVCGGSLIAPCVLLTAKHCTHVIKGTKVQLGYYNLDKPVAGKSKIFTVDKIELPDTIEDYGVGSDLKLVKIYGESKATPVHLDVDEGVGQVDQCGVPPCDYKRTPRTTNLHVTIPGWGSTNFLARPIAFPRDLYKLDTKLTTPEECDQNIDMYFAGRGIIKDRMICTFKDDQTSTFTGDSGGPLIIKGTNNQIGVLYGAPTDRTAGLKTKSVYSNIRVDDLIWIDKYINKEYGEWKDCNCTMEPSMQPSMQPSMNPSPNPTPSGPSESPKPSMSPSLSPTCHPSSTGHACGGKIL